MKKVKVNVTIEGLIPVEVIKVNVGWLVIF